MDAVHPQIASVGFRQPPDEAYLDGSSVSSNDMPVFRALHGEKVKNSIMAFRKSGIERILSVDSVPIYRNNKLEMAAVFTHDVTESVQNQRMIVKNQKQLLQAEEEKNAALQREINMKVEFLSLISHEFKTPITVINSALKAIDLICKNELSETAKGLLDKIQKNSNRQLKLVNNILDITRLKDEHYKIHKKDIDIVLFTKLITESINIFAEQKSIGLSFYSTLKEKVIGIDEESYEKILLNLLSNAVKFTPAGKSIAVKVSQKTVNHKYKVCIMVEDEGIGIPNDKKGYIFEKFGQVDSSLSRQAEGAGIGLSLVKMLVELLGGEITCESELVVGSTFTLLLPAEKVDETPIEQMVREYTDNRLIRSAAIEFSDIYF